MKILLAEDDVKSAHYIQSGLEEAGWAVEWFSDGRDALTFCLYNDCDLVVMDRMMPGMDGLSVLKSLRAAGKQVPVIFLAAMANVNDRVAGLVAGADDYMVKPFHFSELLARIEVLRRRPKETVQKSQLQVHDLSLDLFTRMATRQGQVIELQNKEFSLLELLMSASGRVISRTMILEQVWGFNFDPGTTVVETHISKLRQKVDKPFAEPLIHTIRNMGYSLRAPQ